MKQTILILHGWGRHISGKTYSELKKNLIEKGFDVYTPDLPGFGSNKIDKDLEFSDYIEFAHSQTNKILKEKNIKKIILLGHSFGGRIAIRFTKQYPNLVDGLILTGASGILRPLPSLRKKLVFLTTKIIRPLFQILPFSFFYTFFRKIVYFSIGEMDYYNAGNLSNTFRNVYKVSIIDDLEKISVPTLIVWGEHDTVTPLEDGKLMYSKIPHAELIIVKDEGHKLPYNAPLKLAKIIEEFLT